jgi:Zn-dependent protease with chaperone function
VRAAWRTLLDTRRLGRQVRSNTLRPSDELRRAADAAGLPGKVDALDAEEPFSFVHGLLHPRVAVSRGMIERLSSAELRAALEHEGYHLRHRDPLRSLIATALTEALFLLPSLAVLQRRYEAGRELAADTRAEQVCGRRPLAGALLKALEGSSLPEEAAVAGLASPDLLSLRVARLEEGQAPRLSTGHLSDHLWSAIGAGVLLGLFASAIVGVGGDQALGHAVAAELDPTGGALQALCLAPPAALAVLAAKA